MSLVNEFFQFLGNNAFLELDELGVRSLVKQGRKHLFGLRKINMALVWGVDLRFSPSVDILLLAK